MKVFAVLVLCAAGTFATPARHRREQSLQQTCATQCSGAQTKFKYAPGKAYVYDLTSETKVQLGGNQVQTTVSQTATVTFNVQSPCELSMKLSNVKLTGADVPTTWASDLEKLPLRFSFDDGTVQNVCPQANEPTWSLNIKRAILSTFQNALEGQDNDGFEVDVSGRCPTQYENEGSGDSVNIKRTKNLGACRDNHFQHGTVRSMSYDVRSQIQNTPLMDSEQSCQHTIKNRLLQQATCTEKHTFQPFTKQAREDSAIYADVEQTLKFKSETSSDSSAFPAFDEQQALTFDHSEFGVEQTENPQQGAQQSVERLCQSSMEEARPETPGLFAELVYNIRRLNEQQLRAVYDATKQSPACAKSPRFFLDALPMCGTEHCVALMVHLVTTNVVDQTAELEWYTSLALVSRPNANVLKAILPLMDRVPASGLLGISSMAHSFCRHNSRCSNSNDLKNLVKKIQTRLGESCAAKTETEIQEIVYALKAIGNVGNDDSVVPTLVRCFLAKVNPIEVRLAAVRALRRQSCEAEQAQPLLKTYKDNNEQAELRIVAFVELMRCPTSELLDQIKEQLEQETINQVGSYVYSYLTEKRRSSDPGQRHISSLLLRYHFDQKFNRDPRRFSRFTELGFFNDKTNVGAHAQSSVIFSPEGYLPRQASLNLTVHLFGRSVNFLEVGARTEGLEKLVDRLTGPDGYFTNPNGFLFREKSTAHKNSRVQSLHDLYKKRGNVHENDHLAASTYVKIFGDEIAYYGFTDYNAVDQIKEMLDVGKLLQKLADERDIKFNRNFVFLETTTTIPTASGLPLRLAVNGTAAINVQVKGKADLTKILMPNNNFEIDMMAKPSAAVEIAAMLGVQTGAVRQGVKMIARMHTSTNVGAHIQFREGRYYSAKLSLPDDQMELLDIQSEMFQVINNRYQEHPQHRAGAVQKVCTPEIVGDITGLKLCGEAQLGTKALSYPFRATVTLEKADPTLQSYDFLIEGETVGENRKLKVGFNTPGSTKDRKMEAAFEYKPQNAQNALTVNLRTPFKQIDIEGQLKAGTDRNNYEAKVKLTADKKDVYEMDGTFKIENPGKMSKYALTAAAKANNGAPAGLESAFEYDTETYRSAKMNLNVENIFSKPVNFNTEFEFLEAGQTFPKYVGKVEYNGPDMEAKVDTHLEQRGGLDYDVKFEVEYTKEGGQKHNFLAQGTQTIQRSGRDYKLLEAGKFETSLLPNAKVEYELKSEKNDLKWNNELTLSSGARKSRYVANVEKRDRNLFYTTVEAKCDTLKLDHKAVLQYQNQLPTQFLAKAELDTPKTKGMVAEVSVDTSMNPKWNLEALATLKYPGRELKFQKSVSEKSAGNYKMHTEVQWEQGKKVEFDSDMVVKSTEGETEYTVDGVAKITGQKDPIHIRKHYKSDERQSTYHWVAKRGSETVYDFRYNIDGQNDDEQKKTMSAHLKSQIVAQIDYELNGEMTPTAEQTEVKATIKNNGEEYGKIEVVIPKAHSAANKQVKGLITWDLNTAAPKELMGEWKKVTEGKRRVHDFTFNGKSHGQQYKLNAKVEKGDYYKMNCTVEKANKPLLSVNFGMKDNRNDFSQVAVDLGFKSYEPLQKHQITSQLLANFQPDNFKMLAEVDCKELSSRWFVNAEGSSKPEGSETLYKLMFDVEAPGHEVHVSQQAKGKTIIEPTKATSTIELTWDSRSKKIEHVVDLERTATGVKGSSTTKTPFQILTVVKESYEYSFSTGAAHIKHEIEWNNNKKVGVELKGKNKETEIGLDAKLTTSFESAKKADLTADCKKVDGYWNCKAATNVNDKYKLSAHQEQADNRQKLGFDADLPGITKSSGHVLANINAPTQKYNVEVQFQKNDNLYKIAADLNGQKETGVIKVQTPLTELKTAKVTITKTGDEYEIKTERNGATEGTVIGQLRLDDENQRIRLMINDVSTPFEFIAQNIKEATKQNALFEVTIDPKGEKRTYGAEVEYATTDDRLSKARFTLTHPRRQMSVELDRPTEEKINIMIHPSLGTNRAPTKLELDYKENGKGFKCEAKMSDPSLKRPIHCKFEKTQTGPCGEDDNCEIVFTSEFDYSGEPEKLLKQKLRLSRVYDTAAKSVKRRSVDVQGKVQKFIYEHSLEHAETNLHVKLWAKADRLVTEEYTIPTNIDTGIEFKNKNKQIVQYSTIVDYRPMGQKPSAFIRINSGEHWVKIEGRTDFAKKEVNVYLYQNDPEPKMVATLTVNPEMKMAQLEVRTNEDGDVQLHLSARMVDAYTASVKVWHTENGRREDDADIKIQLDRSDLLKTKFFLRPAINRDLIKKAGDLQTTVQNAHRSNAVRESLQSFSESQKLLLEDFAREMQPMMQGWAEEQRTLAEEMGAGYQELLDNIELYGQMVKEVVWACLDMLNQAIEQMAAEMPTPAVGEYYRQFKTYMSELPRQTVQFFEPARDYLKVVGEKMNDLQDKLVDTYNHYATHLNLQKIRDAIRDFCDKVTGDNEIMTAIIEFLKQLSDNLKLPKLSDYFDNMQKQYEQYKTNAVGTFTEYKNQLMDFAAANGLTQIVQPIVEPITNLDVHGKAKDFIKYVRGMLSGDESVKQYWQQYAPHITVNQPDQGRFEMEIPLPVKANSLEDLVDQMHPDRLGAMQQAIKDKFTPSQSNGAGQTEDDEEIGYSVWDTIHKYKPASWNIRDQIPPFKSTAYLIGNQHIVTFDGHVFDFTAGCEYLLARDFHDGKFTIVAAFERLQGKTVLSFIRTEFAGQQITMFRTGKVEVDGKAEQLPWQKVESLNSEVTIKVERRDHSTVLTTYDEIEIECDSYYHVCQVTLPGRYHSKSSGLLGSNDNEPLNDLDFVDGTDNNDVNAMATQWSVSGDCKANEADTETADSANSDCRNMFKSAASVLRPCFQQVAPGPFYKMCLRDMSGHIKSSDKPFEGLCNVTAAYMQACLNDGVTLTPPEQCVRCQNPEGNGQFISGEEVRVTDKPQMKSSDVVFVVEERLCLKNKKQEIEKIAHEIMTKDSTARFGWVGFGGDGVHYEPHLHTAKDSTSFDAAAMRAMINEMSFEPESGMEKPETDPMSAVLFAVEQYAFRSGVQKTIVLVTCQLCNHRDVDHHTLQGALLNQGIVMHVITTEEVKTSDSDNSVGFDAQNLFDKSGKTTGDRSNLEGPNDVCAVIAQETFGTVFSVSAVQTAATKIAEFTKKAQEKNTCQICQCETSELAPRTVCTPCDIVQPASLNSRSFTGIADFFRQREVFLL